MAERCACPCCGYRTLPERDAYDLCPVCFWEDDWRQSDRPGSADGANGVSLIEAQRVFRRIGAVHATFAAKVRRPTTDEARDPDWRFLDDFAQDPPPS